MRELVCIVCPNGCKMSISREGREIKVTGNKCPKGESFGISEAVNPTRTICSTVKTKFPGVPVIPVRVSAEIPKDKIFEVMGEINKVVVEERIGRGDIVVKNVLGLDADVIATSDILRKVD